jgi:outer membrane protein OmpA-like peptidoglycan-associated protein
MKTGFSLFVAVILLTGIAGAQEKSGSNEAIFNFTVTSKRGKPRQGELIMLKSQKTKRVYKASTGSDGKCSVTIPTSDNYTIYYKLFADTVKYKQIDVPGEEHKVVYTLTLKYDPPKTYTLKNVFFETGFSSLKKESFSALNDLVDALKSKPSLNIEIAGHTDNVGNHEANQKLSADRANVVRDYLIKHGIEPNRVIAKGYGETQPVADNDSPEGRQQNRRTEVRIISE